MGLTSLLEVIFSWVFMEKRCRDTPGSALSHFHKYRNITLKRDVTPSEFQLLSMLSINSQMHKSL